MPILSDWDDDKVAMAAQELMQLEKQAVKARLLLARLQAGLVDAGSKLGGEANLLVEANQQLVLSAMQAQVLAEKTARSAELDTLTALPNRLLLLDRFTQAIVLAKRHGTCLALLFLDINNFKKINDTFGHGVGDEVLKHVAHCLSTVVRQADTVSRHGGDEFLVLLAEISQVSDATLIADKIHAALIAPYQIGEQSLALTVSIGVSLYPDHGVDANTLIERADFAMYHAKRNSLGSCVYRDTRIGSNDLLEPPESLSGIGLYKLPPAGPADHQDSLREANEHLIAAVFNAKDRQATAEEMQRRQAEFLAVFAHELRNPLAPIRMAAALLDHVGTDPLQLQELQHLINRQVTRMSRLLDDLFDVARVNSGKFTIVTKSFDIIALIHDVISTYTPLIQKRRQQFIFETPMDELLIEADAGRLTQVISNLFDNASKYTPECGQLKLVVAIKDDMLDMTFSDSGIGITPSTLPHIFEPFMQDSRAAGFNHDGIGIGLTVVRELVASHRGSVTACSAGSGMGSQFIVSLPLRQDKCPRATDANPSP